MKKRMVRQKETDDVQQAMAGGNDLLDAMEKIVAEAKATKLESWFCAECNEELELVSERLGMGTTQAVLFSLLFNAAGDQVTLDDLAKSVGCSKMRFLRWPNEFEQLAEDDWIVCRQRSSDEREYYVPQEIIEALCKEGRYTPPCKKGLTCADLLGELEALFDRRENDSLTYENLVKRVEKLLDDNNELLFVKVLRGYGLREEDRMLLLLFCSIYGNNYDDSIRYHQLEDLFDRRHWRRHKSALMDGSHILLEAKLVEYKPSEGFMDREAFKLTNMAKRELLGEIKTPRTSECDKLQTISPETIKAKRLYYNEAEERQVRELGELLEEKQYADIRQRLRDTGFRTGFACLFYGAPGTGKTETALQLAKATGREVLQINMSEIKSMWVGESEKNIQGVFDVYRAKVANCERAPILLFNEADGIISTRMSGATHAVDKMENTMQNIILQEMETLDGIMIATTNLAENIDKAFERRFLYKIHFGKPSAEAKAHIWREMIPDLDEAQAMELAKRYDFSGGQIENVARLYAIDRILHGACSDPVACLASYCEAERPNNGGRRRVGFV